MSGTLRASGLLALVIPLGLTLGACAAEPEWAGSIEERDGVVYVANPIEGLWSEHTQPPFRVELEQVFGSDGDPRDAMLGNPYQISFDVDEQSNVYVLDGQGSRLVAFSPRAEVLWTAGRAGEGPGEFENPRGLAVDTTGIIAVGNNGSTRLGVWNTGGEYVETLSLVAPPIDLSNARSLRLAGFIGPNTLALSSPLWGGFGSRLHVIRLDAPELVSEFEWNQLPDLPMPRGLSSGLPVRAVHGSILVGSTVGYRFRIYDAAGALQREVTRPVDYPVRSGFYEQEGRRGISGFGELSFPMPLPTGHILVAASWTPGIDNPDAAALESMLAFREGRPPIQRERASSLDLFDESGRFLYSLAGDGDELSVDISKFVGRDGRFYTIAQDPFPQIRRYRVVIEEP